VRLQQLLGFINLALTVYLITQVRRGSRSIMADLTGLQQAVANETTVEQSAITLLNGLAEQLKNAGTDPVAIQAVVDQINSSSAALGGSHHSQHAGGSTSTNGLDNASPCADLPRRWDGTCGFHVYAARCRTLAQH
jgi:hypothetical protein